MRSGRPRLDWFENPTPWDKFVYRARVRLARLLHFRARRRRRARLDEMTRAAQAMGLYDDIPRRKAGG